MGIDLIAESKSLLTDEILANTATFLNEDATLVRNGFDSAIPSILGALARKGDTLSGAGQLLGELKHGGFNGDLLNHLDKAFGGGPATSGLLDSGGALLKGIFGNKLPEMVAVLISNNGPGKSPMHKIFSLSAPLIFHLLGRTIKKEHWDARKINQYFVGLSSILGQSLPEEIADTLGFQSAAAPMASSISNTPTPTMDVKKAAAIRKKEFVEPTPISRETQLPSKGGNIQESGNEPLLDQKDNVQPGIPKWLIPVLLVLIALFLGIKYFGCSDSSDQKDISEINQWESSEDNDVKMREPEGSMLEEGLKSEIQDFLEGPGKGSQIFKLDGLTFSSGEGEISEGAELIKQISEVLNMQDDLGLEIYAYASESGEEDMNQALSELRANVILQRFLQEGLNINQLSAVGRGSSASESGETESNRVELKIIK